MRKERKKEMQHGIYQLQQFTDETKAVAAYKKDWQYVCAKL